MVSAALSQREVGESGYDNDLEREHPQVDGGIPDGRRSFGIASLNALRHRTEWNKGTCGTHDSCAF